MSLVRDAEVLSRRDEVVEAAMKVLAKQGSRGLTHREVDRFLARPLGSTSNYFRKRIDLLSAVGARIMQLDLEDTNRLTDGLKRSGTVTVESVTERLLDLLHDWAGPTQRDRALARIEAIIETVRSDELRAATSPLVDLAIERYSWIFEQLGAANPALSASIFLRLMASMHLLILSGEQQSDRDLILKMLLREWLTVSLQASAGQ